MRKIIKIEAVESLLDKSRKPYFRTHAIVDDGSEVTGFSRNSKEYDLGDKVEVFLHRGVIKMRKSAPTRAEFEDM